MGGQDKLATALERKSVEWQPLSVLLAEVLWQEQEGPVLARAAQHLHEQDVQLERKRLLETGEELVHCGLSGVLVGIGFHFSLQVSRCLAEGALQVPVSKVCITTS